MKVDETLRARVLVTPDALAGLAGAAILAIRNPRGDEAATPRIPGAVDVDLPTELASLGGGARGSRPLPEIAPLQAHARRWGLRQGQSVVVYDHDRGLSAARGWWVLRWAGIADVRVLDGGYAAWTGPVSTSPPTQPPGDVVVRPGAMPVWDAADAAAAEGLVDARVPERYSGATEPVDAVAGHIPGARNVPVRSTVDVSGRLRPADELRELLAGARGAYCGSGVTAAQLVLAMHHAGLGDPALYVGSWSHWITDPGRPIAKGDQP